jgi:hypothetical protein
MNQKFSIYTKKIITITKTSEKKFNSMSYFKRVFINLFHSKFI